MRRNDEKCPVCGRTELCRCYVKPPEILAVRMTYSEVKELQAKGVTLQGTTFFMEKMKELGFDITRDIHVNDDMHLGVYTFTQRI